MAKKKLLQDSEGQIWPITTADCVYLSDGSKTVKKYIDDALDGKANSSHTHSYIIEEDLSGQTISLNTLNLSNGKNNIKYYVCPTDEGGSNITGRPNDNQKTAFNLKVESIRWASATDYISKQTYIRGGEKIIYVRYCTNGTWTAWEKVYTSSQKPTLSELGAAPTSHASTGTSYGVSSASNYGHAMASGTTPKVAGTAAVGSETAKFARGDHVHPAQTTISGNAGSATKLQTQRKINGMVFDGTADITTNWWGSARKLTIGKKEQSVNGSGDISWALSDIMGRAATTSSGNENKNKYTKFARIDISGGTYRTCAGTFDFVSVESGHVFGILTYYLRTGSAITSTTISLAWKTLTNVAYANSVVAVKVSDGIFDLYYKPVNDWDTMSITNINSNGIGYITLYSNQSFTSSVTAASTSSLVNHSATSAKLTTARTLTIGNTGKSFDGSGNVSWSLSEIGAAASSHNHGLLHDSHAVEMTNTTTDSGWSMINSSYNGYILKSIRTNANTPNWICNNFAAGVAFGGGDTKGVLSCAYNAPSIKIAGGNGTKPVWWVGLTGTSGTTYDLNRINTAYTHSQAAHAPSNAQKNSDITKAEIEAKLTGNITSHTHSYAASSHTHNYLTVKGTNTISSTSNDTAANWGAQQTSVHWYSATGKLNDQPNQYGYILNVGQNSEVHQIWMTQSSGDMLHRGGNGSGWNGSWRKLLDNINYSSYALPLTGGSLSGRLGAWGKIGVPTTGGQWISGMDVSNASIGVGTQQTTSSYHPVLGVMTAAGNIINLGGINNDFGFYGYNYGRTENGRDWEFSFDTANKVVNIQGMSILSANDTSGRFSDVYLRNNRSLCGWNAAWSAAYDIAGVDNNNEIYIGWGAQTNVRHRNASYFHQPLFLTRDAVGTMMMDMYTNPNRMEWIWYNSSSGDWDWSKKIYFDANGQFYIGNQLSIRGHRFTPYSENGVSIIRPDGQEFSGLEVKELWIGPYSGATYKFVVSPSAPSASWGTVWVQI